MQPISISIYVFIYIKYIDMYCSFNIISDIEQEIFACEVSWTAPTLRPLRSKRSPPWLTVFTAISRDPPLVSKNSHVNCSIVVCPLVNHYTCITVDSAATKPPIFSVGNISPHCPYERRQWCCDDSRGADRYVSGRKGRQTVNASDFAIAQFRYLKVYYRYC